MNYQEIQFRIDNVRNRISVATKKSERPDGSVTLLGACKQVDRERIVQAVELGVDYLGENQLQEAEQKFKALGRPQGLNNLHLIGNLQSNKVKRAIELFDVIQSIDSVKLASKINTIASQMGRVVPIYLEINISGESTKNGISPKELDKTIELISECRNLNLLGLMTVPPQESNPEKSRPYFRMLREIKEDINSMNITSVGSCDGLSMGMTNDFDVAIEEGATLIRVGSAIWGSRPR